MTALNTIEPNKKKKSKFLIALVEKESENLQNLVRNGAKIDVKNEYGGM